MSGRLFRKFSPLSILFVVGSVLTYAAQTTSSPPSPLLVDGLGKTTVALGGEWQFHLGDDPAWAAPGLDDSGWEQLTADKDWGDQGHYGYTGYAWYRKHIDIAPVAGGDTDLALGIPQVSDAYEVYWNGKLIGHPGNLPPHAVSYGSPEVFEFGRAQSGVSQSGVLAIRVWKAPYGSSDSAELGGLSATPLLGTSVAIADYKGHRLYLWLRDLQYTFIHDTLYGLLALFGLMAWLRDRRQKVAFWVSLFALGPLLALPLTGLRLHIPVNLSSALMQPVFSLEDISLWYLLLYLLELDTNRHLRRWTRILACISILCASIDGVLVMLDWTGHVLFFQISDAALTIPFTLIEAFPLVLIPFALRKRLDPARWLVAIFAFTRQMFLVARIDSYQGIRFTHFKLGEKIDAPLFTLNGNPFSAITMASTCLLIAIVYAVYRYTSDQSKRQGALEQELKSAQELQRVLIPESLPSVKGYAVTSAYSPAQEVGGDFFQLITNPDGSALLILGDVSGKGLKAAMTVSLIVGALRTLAEISDDPADILAGLNRRLHGRLKNGFVTCLVLRIDPDGQCVLANAGHPSPFLNEHELELPGTLPLGLVPSASYVTSVIHLTVNDRLMLYTDGLLEARNASGEIYSFDRLRSLVNTRPDARQATEAAVAFGQEDDITVLTVTRLETGVESTTSLLAPELISSTA